MMNKMEANVENKALNPKEGEAKKDYICHICKKKKPAKNMGFFIKIPLDKNKKYEREICPECTAEMFEDLINVIIKNKEKNRVRKKSFLEDLMR